MRELEVSCSFPAGAQPSAWSTVCTVHWVLNKYFLTINQIACRKSILIMLCFLPIYKIKHSQGTVTVRHHRVSPGKRSPRVSSRTGLCAAPKPPSAVVTVQKDRARFEHAQGGCPSSLRVFSLLADEKVVMLLGLAGSFLVVGNFSSCNEKVSKNHREV